MAAALYLSIREIEITVSASSAPRKKRTSRIYRSTLVNEG